MSDAGNTTNHKEVNRSFVQLILIHLKQRDVANLITFLLPYCPIAFQPLQKVPSAVHLEHGRIWCTLHIAMFSMEYMHWQLRFSHVKAGLDQNSLIQTELTQKQQKETDFKGKTMAVQGGTGKGESLPEHWMS